MRMLVSLVSVLALVGTVCGQFPYEMCHYYDGHSTCTMTCDSVDTVCAYECREDDGTWVCDMEDATYDRYVDRDAWFEVWVPEDFYQSWEIPAGGGYLPESIEPVAYLCKRSGNCACEVVQDDAGFFQRVCVATVVRESYVEEPTINWGTLCHPDDGEYPPPDVYPEEEAADDDPGDDELYPQP